MRPESHLYYAVASLCLVSRDLVLIALKGLEGRGHDSGPPRSISLGSTQLVGGL